MINFILSQYSNFLIRRHPYVAADRYAMKDKLATNYITTRFIKRPIYSADCH